MQARLRTACLLLGAAACAGTLVPVDGRRFAGWWAGVLALALAVSTVTPRVNGVWRALRTRPLACWSFVLATTSFALGAWVCGTQPVWGRIPPLAQLASFAAVLVVALAPFTSAPAPDARREQRERLRSSAAARCLLVLTTFVSAFFTIEGFLRVFCVQTDGFAVTAMHRAWMELHWAPLNSLGFRDREPVAEPGVKHVLVVGDSFTAAHGLEDVEYGFPRVLERGLGAGWRVNVAARPGWSTDAEFAALWRYPLRPDAIVLSYYINDMSYLLPKARGGLREPPFWARWFANGFFSTSYVYWHVMGGGLERVNDRYAHDQLASYDDAGLWELHAKHLLDFVNFTREEHVRFVVLVWPRLDDVESSRSATEKVTRLFREQGVTVVDMTDELAARSPRELVVNRLDAHPNVATHALAGTRLLEALRAR